MVVGGMLPEWGGGVPSSGSSCSVPLILSHMWEKDPVVGGFLW